MHYHHYLLQAQQQQVAGYVSAIAAHNQLEQQLEQTIQQLQQLQLAADLEASALDKRRSERQQLLQLSLSELSDKELALKKLEQDRQALHTLIERIEKQRQLDLAREAERQRREAEQARRQEQERLAREAAERAAQPPVEVGSHIEPAEAVVVGAPRAEVQSPAEPTSKKSAREQSPSYSANDLAKLKNLGFSKSRGQLPQPVHGRLINRYGQTRQGEIKWEGMRIAAPVGSEVRAVHGGRVMYADWLRGQGMLLVIDHGEGYMTLYAHNDVLLKNPGDFVEPGATVARVGNSGGEQEAALYFEIRHNGATINPEPWLRR